MKYSKKLRERFPSITLIPEDLFFLESFQVKYLPDRVPQKEFAALLRLHPSVQRFLISKCPPIEGFVETILKENKSVVNQVQNEKYCQDLLWEIADLIIYNKYPEIYDATIDLQWDITEIVPAKSLKGKIVIDVGAGSGRIAFLVAPFSKTVFAVEPVCSFRNFIRDKAKKDDVNNLFTIDGFLNSVPLPDNFADVLFTSNAIGWNLKDELLEIERVLKPGGNAIHLLKNTESNNKNPFHQILTSEKWNYKYFDYVLQSGMKLKYSKVIK